MRTAYLALPGRNPLKWHITFTLLFCAVVALAASPAVGAPWTTIDKVCTLSTQLQTSPFREQYIARLAMDSEIMLASNTPDDSSVQSDTPSLLTLLIGSPRTRTSNGMVDAFSQDCLSCHDGMAASHIEANYTNSPGTARQHKYNGSKDHPIGMDYQMYVAFGEGKFKSVSLVNSKMKFIDGKVGCLTCHNPLNPEKGHMVMSDFGSALCRTCHNL
jgi:hypothetical protein